MARRLLRWKGLLALAAVAAVVTAVLALLLPSLVTRAVQRRFADAGLPDARFRFEAIRPDRLVLRDLRLDATERHRTERFTAHFDPVGLLRGEPLTELVLDDTTLSLRIGPDGWPDPGPLTPLLQTDADASTEPPARRIDLKQTRLEMQGVDDTTLQAALSASIGLPAGGAISGTLSLNAPAEAPVLNLTADARYNGGRSPGAAAVGVEVTDLERAAALLRPFGHAPGVDLAGQLRLDAKGSGTPNDATIEATVSGQHLVASTAAWRLAAALDGTCNLRWSDGVLSAGGTVSATNAEAGAQNWDMNVYGIDTTIRMRALRPPATDGDQTLRAGRIYVGKLHLTDAELVFALDADGTVRVRSFSCGWGGGTLRAEDFALAPDAAVWTLPLELENIELSEVFALLPGDVLAGEARLSGTLPVRIRRRGGGLPVDFGEGVIQSDPPEGWFRVERRDELRKTLERADKTLKNQSFRGVRENLLDILVAALMEYHFAELRIRFRRTGGESVPQLYLRAREEEERRNPVRIATLEINLRGLADVLRRAILRSEEEIRPAVGKELDKVFAP